MVVFAVQYFNHLPLALKVEYDGKELGYITDESVFQEAEAAMKGRIIEGAQVVDVSEIVETGPQEQENGEDSQEEDTAQQDDNASSQDQQEEESGMEEEPVQEEPPVEDEPVLEESVSEEQKPYKAKDIIPRFTLSVLKPYEQVMSADRLTNELIKASGNELEEGDGLYINGKLVGAVTDSTALLTELDNMLQQYEQQASAPQEEEEPAQEDAEEQEQADVVTIGEPKVQFVKKVELESGLYPVSSIRTVDQIMFTLKGEERGEKIYTVVSGDTPLRIAAKNGITLDELKTLNPGVELSLFPGDELLISQSVPYMGVQTTKTIKYQEEMPYQIEQQTDPNQNIGWTPVLQEGSTWYSGSYPLR